jgi:hypothetical protein
MNMFGVPNHTVNIRSSVAIVAPIGSAVAVDIVRLLL